MNDCPDSYRDESLNVYNVVMLQCVNEVNIVALTHLSIVALIFTHSKRIAQVVFHHSAWFDAVVTTFGDRKYFS